ncbi:septum formation family protein [Nocardioides mesophilus]|uniref:Septum formation family protein n=1 Tax=Nocardioides mesophilus TaxID=433659 RepID=A0A7G9RCL0_9ACTN|nr:septum formation family protein [Nocardioides mesophilus]QNN53335.1 septum formation family protein [Nocardioides mesophilus]
MLARLLVPLLALLGACTACTGGPGADPVSTQPPEPGQCRALGTDDIARAADESDPVDCADRHTAETFAVGRFPRSVAGDEIDDAALGAHLFDGCRRKFQAFLGGDESVTMRSTVTWSWFRPSDAAWDAGARWWRCDVVGGGEQSVRLLDLPETAKGLLRGKPDDQWMACTDGAAVGDAPTTPCSEDHTWRAVTTIVLGEPADPYPGDDLVKARTRAFCSDSVGAWLGYPVDFDYGFSYFDRVEWDAGNRRSICWARTDR